MNTISRSLSFLLEGRESQLEFPLKTKYDLMNADFSGRDNLARAVAPAFDDDGVPPQIKPESMGTSYIGPYHRGMYARDRLGNKYPVDRWGVRVFFNRDPEKVYRPEDVEESRWRKATPALRAEWAGMFPPRRQGVEPDGETERVIRDRENEERREKKSKKIIARAAVATLGISSLRSASGPTDLNVLSSDDGETVLGSGSDRETTGRALRRREKFTQKRRGRREVK